MPPPPVRFILTKLLPSRLPRHAAGTGGGWVFLSQAAKGRKFRYSSRSMRVFLAPGAMVILSVLFQFLRMMTFVIPFFSPRKTLININNGIYTQANGTEYQVHIYIMCQILSPSKTGFIVSAHRLIYITLLTLIATL